MVFRVCIIYKIQQHVLGTAPTVVGMKYLYRRDAVYVVGEKW